MKAPTLKRLFRAASLHIIGPGLSVMLLEVVGHMSLYLQQTPEKKPIKDRYNVHGV